MEAMLPAPLANGTAADQLPRGYVKDGNGRFNKKTDASRKLTMAAFVYSKMNDLDGEGDAPKACM